ncbi:MAG: MarR family transcriptional regulator [Methylobacteriaceae bacterium]|nr:MarR family transcriptional regulator [Methylobacteriaceae bacterium]MBV9220487.1 MarR family transcriptional regulator [Methylobacteriaceae bacterium]MBV9247330.1 MarR family transcriptional regulator [Methylobacteriaceae bacterium]MBV9705296.1 MarR family transcriptional regulator [Methylobacteriaceae bacterium]
MSASFDSDLLFLIHDLARGMRTRADQRARRRGMTRAQWVILARLERQPGMFQNELASIVEVEPITIARLVDRLEARGFVERRPDPADRRLRRLHLLPAATSVLEEIHAYRAELNELLTAGVEGERVEALTRDLKQMKANLLAEPRDARAV